MNWTILVEFVEQNLLPILAALVCGQLLTLVLLLVLWCKRRQQVAAAPTDLTTYLSQLQQLETSLQSLRAELASLQTRQASAIQHVGFSRFNAFPDSGGELSFALALLNGQQDGFVLTSLYGRQEARVYAKPIESGISPVRLSPEEQEALRQALYSKN